MTETSALPPEEVMWEGKYIVTKKRGTWEYVGRSRGIHAAVILAIDESEGERVVILVEQFRMPLGRPCLELPAGLVGDECDGEETEGAAARELEEETGYRAAEIECIGTFYSSPGMVSESYTLVRARGLNKVGEGGGVDGENITVHRVPLSGLSAFIDEKRNAGCGIDGKLLLLLGTELAA